MLSSNNLGALFDAEHGGDRLAFIDCQDWERPREWTHRQIDAAADACARGLLTRGLARGDALGLLAANRIEFLIAYLGALRAGLVAVPFNHKFPHATLALIAADSGIKLLLHDAARREGARAACAGRDIALCDFDAEGADGFDALLDPGPHSVFEPDAHSVAMVLYTSGSTGRPKGVPLTHHGHMWALRARLGSNWPFVDHRLLIAAPLYHMNALCVSLVALASAASAVLMPEFNAVRYLQAVERFGCTWLTSVPTMIAMCLREHDTLARTDLGSVSIVRMGSAPVSARLLEQVREVFPRASIMNGYGTTEAGPVVFGPRADRAPPDGAAGWPAPDVDVKLVDADGRESDHGVLWQRTPATATHYLNLPQKSAEAFTSDGWYRSGDVFRRDADGLYYFVGRDDDMFVCGGENVYPGEVEHVLETHPDVAQSCVVPVPDELKGFKPVAFVVPVPGSALDARSVQQHALANAAPYLHPRAVHLVDALPLAGPGKVDRKLLTERAAELWSANLS